MPLRERIARAIKWPIFAVLAAMAVGGAGFVWVSFLYAVGHVLKIAWGAP